MSRIRYIAAGFLIIVPFFSCAYIDFVSDFNPSYILPSGETDPVPHGGDAADDCAIWINSADASLSRVIAADKKGGLAVYDLQGNMTSYLNDGLMNNIDLRSGFNLSGTPVSLIAASNRSSKSISIYKMNEALMIPENAAARLINTNFADAYGLCMYRSSITGFYYIFVTDHEGRIEQWRVYDNGAGSVDAVLSRTLRVSSTAEGCAASDEKGILFVAEEHGGIWMFDAEPSGSSTGIKAASIMGNSYLVSELEGVSLFSLGADMDYLLVSVQGNDSFAVFHITGEPAVLEWKGSFRIASNIDKGIDRVTHTDGIDVYYGYLGPDYPDGIFIAQDDENTPSGLNQNFKYVALGDLISGIGL